MSDDLSPELRRELLDDFYTEADELLGQIRVHLAELERQPHEAARRETIEAVFRSMHSFKGDCGIIGLRVAEQLAHAVEDLLRSVSRGGAALDDFALDLVARSAHRLEQIVTAHRHDEPLPAIADLLAPLESFRAPAPSAPAERVATAPRPEAAPGRAWKATFTPSAELSARGINVTSVRERLSALGNIIRAAPVVRSDGTMYFEFTVALREPPADVAGWAAEGVEFREVEEAAAFARSPAPRAEGEATSAGRTSGETAAPSSLSIAPSHLVRVDLGRLDELMRIMGEMVIHRSRLEDRIAQLPGDRSALQEVNLALARSLRDLRGAITRVRLVPVAEIFSRLPYLVRDLTRETGKKVRLVLEGQGTEIDKFLVERLKEPLLHLVRNAFSHGIESPAERIAAGKPEEATLTLRAATAGQRVVIEVHDDGRGIDAQRIVARAAALGLNVPDAPTEADLLEVLCHSGFSTRDEADFSSGRGVGMAVVHATLHELGGLLSFETQPQQGTRFTLRLPVTLSIIDAIIVSSGPQTCAVPQGFVDEILQFEEEQVRTVKNVEVIPYRDGVLPLVRLATLLRTEREARVRIPILVVNSERGSAGLVVDRVFGQREVVVRPMTDPLVHVRGVSGATELGDGRPVLILDPAALTSGAVRPGRARAAGPAPDLSLPASA